MLVTMIDDDPFVGRIATGRIASGVIRVNDRVKVITRDGAVHANPPSVPESPLCLCRRAPPLMLVKMPGPCQPRVRV